MLLGINSPGGHNDKVLHITGNTAMGIFGGGITGVLVASATAAMNLNPANIVFVADR